MKIYVKANSGLLEIDLKTKTGRYGQLEIKRGNKVEGSVWEKNGKYKAETSVAQSQLFSTQKEAIKFIVDELKEFHSTFSGRPFIFRVDGETVDSTYGKAQVKKPSLNIVGIPTGTKLSITDIGAVKKLYEKFLKDGSTENIMFGIAAAFVYEDEEELEWDTLYGTLHNSRTGDFIADFMIEIN